MSSAVLQTKVVFLTNINLMMIKSEGTLMDVESILKEYLAMVNL
jgi:hypothetical protein